MENDESLSPTEEAIRLRILESLENWEWEEYIPGDISEIEVVLTGRIEKDVELEDERSTTYLTFEVSLTVEEEYE